MKVGPRRMRILRRGRLRRQSRRVSVRPDGSTNHGPEVMARLLLALLFMSTRVRVGVFVAAYLLASCTQEPGPTPQDVSTRFHAMLDTLDVNHPGAALLALDTFMNNNPSYTVADSVEREILEWRGAIQGRYHQARELARDGEFDRAERMLKDLALLPQTEDGASAAQHLEFEFYFEKAKWLMVRQRFQESEAVARELLSRDLNRFQRDQV